MKMSKRMRWMPLALAVMLSACGGPTYFLIQGYPDAVRPSSETFTVKSTNYTMRLVAVDGRKGRYEPIASGPAAYAGFDLKLLPGKHQLKAFCWVYMGVSEILTDKMTIDVEGAAGESYDAGCVSDGKRFHLEVRRSTPP